MGDGDAVVGHRHALGTALFRALEHETAVEHAAATVDDQVIARQILGEILARNDIDFQSLSHALSQHAGDFFAPDVLGQRGMGAGLGDEHARLLCQAVDGGSALDEVLDVALVGRHQHRKGREQALGWLFLRHDVKYL